MNPNDSSNNAASLFTSSYLSPKQGLERKDEYNNQIRIDLEGTARTTVENIL